MRMLGQTPAEEEVSTHPLHTNTQNSVLCLICVCTPPSTPVDLFDSQTVSNTHK